MDKVIHTRLSTRDSEDPEVELGETHLLHPAQDSHGKNSAAKHPNDSEFKSTETQRQWHDCKEWPGIWSVAFAVTTLLTCFVLAGALFTQHHKSPTHGMHGGSTANGVIKANINQNQDWLGRSRTASGSQGAVSADHGRCSDMGLDILKRGGNAVDATVTTALCEGIYNSMASGVGGGGFLTILSPNSSAEIIDARETAPGAATEGMYKGKPHLAVEGGLAIAVPLELRGLALAHSRHGTLPWASLLDPIIPLARHGFPAHPYLVAALSSPMTLARFQEVPMLREIFLVKDGDGWRPPVVNETCCRRPALADFLQDVASEGPDIMHTGRYAAPLAADVQAAGGILTVQDLATAQPQVKAALRAHVFGMDLIFPPPPSSAAAIVTALRILEGYELRLPAAGTLGTHRMVEAMKHAFALRMSLGDPGRDANQPFVNVTDVLDSMLSPKFADSLRLSIKDGSTQNVTDYGGRFNKLRDLGDDHGTCHFNVVDGKGSAVAMTTTVNTGFGSHVISPSTGMLLNNEMDDFSTPGQPNIYNLPPSEANFIRPGKKPLSSMSPIIVLRSGKLRAVVGASGGPLIVSSVFQTLLRILAECTTPLEAVTQPRYHHQLLPNTVLVENWSAHGVDIKVAAIEIQGLERRGHNVTAFPYGAVVQAILVDPDSGMFTAISDPRKDGAPAAF